MKPPIHAQKNHQQNEQVHVGKRLCQFPVGFSISLQIQFSSTQKSFHFPRVAGDTFSICVFLMDHRFSIGGRSGLFTGPLIQLSLFVYVQAMDVYLGINIYIFIPFNVCLNVTPMLVSVFFSISDIHFITNFSGVCPTIMSSFGCLSATFRRLHFYMYDPGLYLFWF